MSIKSIFPIPFRGKRCTHVAYFLLGAAIFAPAIVFLNDSIRQNNDLGSNSVPLADSSFSTLQGPDHHNEMIESYTAEAIAHEDQIASKHEANQDPILPEDYLTSPNHTDFCKARYETQYLHDIVANGHQYCEPEHSASTFKCYSTQTIPERLDYMCTADHVVFDPDSGLFDLNCFTDEDPFPGFPKYMYHTGIGFVLDEFFTRPNLASENKIDLGSSCPENESPKTAVLSKRDRSGNLWHGLMDIMSYTLTMDALAIEASGASNEEKGILANSSTQVILMDDYDIEPFSALWNLFAEHPTINIGQLREAKTRQCFDRVIIPLPGGSNPLWHGCWETFECDHSSLLDAFRRRVWNHYGISPRSRMTTDLVVTVVERRKNRHLQDHEELVAKLSQKYAGQGVTVQSFDFATMSFAEQLAVVSNTNVLVGLHGAGLTHALFLPPPAHVVEILPADLYFKGFRNAAKMTGHEYFSIHAHATAETQRTDWHEWDLAVETDRFMELMEVAIKSAFHMGMDDRDVN